MGGHGFGLAMAFEVARVVGVGVGAPLVGAGVLVVPDSKRGDPGFEIVARGEVAAAKHGCIRHDDVRAPAAYLETST